MRENAGRQIVSSWTSEGVWVGAASNTSVMLASHLSNEPVCAGDAPRTFRSL